MNILIITPFYKHDKNIASIRWTSFGIRLAKKHNVIIVTQPHDDMDMSTTIEKDENGILVARINQKTLYERLAIKHFGGATGDDWQTVSNANDAGHVTDSTIRIIKNRLFYGSMSSKVKDYTRFIRRNVIPNGTTIDVVISSAGPFIEMLFGYELKKRLNCKWICDFRDLPYQIDNCDDTHIQRRIMQKSLNEADAIVTIANKGKQKLSEIVNNPDLIYVIRNGFSLSDARKTITITDDVLHIVHTGSLYGGIRKADLFFAAAVEAKKQEPNFKYVLECAGGNSESLIATAKKYDEETNVNNRGFVSRDEALDMQGKADILLAIVIDQPGTLVAKLYEYMLNQKPVICVSSGDSLERSEETDFVTELNLGIAVEEKDGDYAVKQLSDYILMQWRLKIEGKPLEYRPDNDKIKEFNHSILVQKIESLCVEC